VSDITRRQLALLRAREGIPVSAILERLGQHLDGKTELTATQLRAAEILLRKSMPDLTSVEMSGTLETTVRSADELRAKAKQLGMNPDELFG
jgi:hypothetical protein